MPRRPRLYLPDQPQHVVVRGHNRDPIFARHDDFRFFYAYLRDAKEANGLAVHAWVFMHNHIHLLVTPGDKLSLSRTMQSLGRRYAQYFNRSYHRSGSLWEGRYKSSMVDTERYLLACYRYIELNPVRAGVVLRPEEYPYSSYHANALGKADSLLTPHVVYLDLICGGEGTGSPVHGFVGTSVSGASEFDHAGAYREIFQQELSGRELTVIRRGTENGLGIGQAEFMLKVAKLGSKG